MATQSEEMSSRSSIKETPNGFGARRKDKDLSLPAIRFPVVPPLEKETSLQMNANRRAAARSAYSRAAQKSQSTSNSVQNVLQKMIGVPKKSGTPCGNCDCCRSLLTYVTAMRNFMDHLVSGMSQGVAEDNLLTPPPDCILCSVQQVDHVQHIAKGTIIPNSLQDDQANHRNIPPTAENDSFKPTNRPDHLNINKLTNRPDHLNINKLTDRPDHLNINKLTDRPDHLNINKLTNRPDHLNNRFPSTTSLTQNQSSRPPGDDKVTSVFTETSNHTESALSSNKNPIIHENLPQENFELQNEMSRIQKEEIRPLQEKILENHQQSTKSNPCLKTLVLGSPSSSLKENESILSTYKVPDNCPNIPAPTSIGQLQIQQTNNQSHEEQENRSYEELSNCLSGREPSYNQSRGESPKKIGTNSELFEAHFDEDNVFIEQQFDGIEREAYVTIVTDNTSAIECLVLGNSLLLSGTSRKLVAVITEEVSAQMRTLLSCVFHDVHSVDMMESPGTTSLALLEEPELGVSFNKLLVWGLAEFSKAVFLDSNTLVVQNCDELFDREELSAVPDIGWPDCFNTDVFVYKPSLDTFWSLVQFAGSRDSFEGGESGLLNSYYQNWCKDISKKLPFLYNMKANVSYTYKPAFKHFGNRVKIVNFFGSYKPMDVQFHSTTGQMAGDANVHPTYAQFVYYWLEIFTKRVLPLLPQEAHEFVNSNEYCSAMDLIKFFPSNGKKRRESLPNPPSIRMYSDSFKSVGKLSVGEPEAIYDFDNDDDHQEQSFSIEEAVLAQLVTEEIEAGEVDETLEQIETATGGSDGNIPGSQIGNFQGMSAWEQGRADYLGKHNSDDIMARLDFFIGHK